MGEMRKIRFVCKVALEVNPCQQKLGQQKEAVIAHFSGSEDGCRKPIPKRAQ